MQSSPAKPIMRSCSRIAFALLFASPAFAVQGPSVLLLHADNDGSPSLQAELVATGHFSGVAELDVSNNGTLPLESDLEGFDVILCYSDLPFQDAEALGDLLANRVDAGQAVVVGPAASSISTVSYTHLTLPTICSV